MSTHPHPENEPVQRIAHALRERLGEAPPTAIVLGSGLGAVVARVNVTAEAASSDLGLPQSTVIGHAGRIAKGRLGDADVVLQSGRVHCYEGHSPAVVVRAIRAFHAWGVKRVILTCSAGGIASGLDPGALVLLSDHLNLQGRSPLEGPAYATRFPDLSDAYHSGMRATLKSAAKELGIHLPEGVYAAMLGPSYETPAEIRMVRTLGCDVVGMSTVPEVIAANELGMPVCAVAVVSNRAAGLTASPLTHDEVTDIAGGAAKRLADLFEVALGRL